MSKLFLFIALCLLIIAEIKFNFNFEPLHIFGFIILWRLLQLMLLWLEHRQKHAPLHLDLELDNAKPPVPFEPRIQTETQERGNSPHPSIHELELKLTQERDAWLNEKQQVYMNTPTLDIPHSASHIEISIQASRAIEEILENKLGAYGKGLHSKLSSVEEKLSSHMVNKIRFIATIRNKTVHSTNASFEKSDFIRTTQDILSYLNSL